MNKHEKSFYMSWNVCFVNKWNIQREKLADMNQSSIVIYCLNKITISSVLSFWSYKHQRNVWNLDSGLSLDRLIEGRFGPIQLAKPCHLLFKCLCQFRKVSGHVFEY